MSKTIHIALKQAPEQLIQQAKAAADKNGVNMQGDADSGCFSGMGVEGEYSVEGQTLTVTISKKPLIMPWAFIEKSVRDFFS